MSVIRFVIPSCLSFVLSFLLVRQYIRSCLVDQSIIVQSHIFQLCFSFEHISSHCSGLENKESDQGWVITIGSVTLQVAQGDLTKETTDAIVNSTNETMKLANGENL